MAPQEDLSKHVARKLTKRRKPMRASSVQYPDRLKEGDDVNEDVTAPKGQSAQYMNQSVFSMIAAAGSKVDFHARFEGESSDSEDDDQISSKAPNLEEHLERRRDDSATRSRSKRQQDKSVERRGFRQLPKLNLKTIKEKNYMSQSVWLPSGKVPSDAESLKGVTPRDAPVMGKMLEAQATLSPTTQRSDIGERFAEDDRNAGSPTSLRTRLMEIFGFESPEEVISEYPCWLLRSILLQGYMYITQKHICFYAYLAKKSNVVAKSGHLSKRGRHNPKYNRYWFTLKGDVLSYYTDPSNTYFPSGNIDLQYGMSASLTHSKEKGKETKDFSVVTDKRVYHFRADSSVSAKEWVKTLQKVIFRSHNDGDSVKISLPIENVVDIEESRVIDFAETLKVSVVHSDDTYAVEEYFFSFFSFGQDALNVLRTMVADTTAQKIPQGLLSLSPAGDEARSRDSSRVPRTRKRYELRGDSPVEPSTPVLHESVRATLVPFCQVGSGLDSPRVSGDWGRRSMDLSTRDFSRASFDQSRRSASGSRNRLTGRHKETQESPLAPHGSTDSFVHSLEQGTESSAPNFSSNDTQASGSQILDRSDVFQSPTIHQLQKPLPRPKLDKRGRSFDSARRSSGIAHINVRPPSRSQTDLSDTEIQQGLNSEKSELSQADSSPALQQIFKAGAYPLQRAAGLAGYIRSRSKKMSNLLATESMGYVEKVSGMWAGGRRHYGEREGPLSDDRMEDPDDEGDPANYGDNFRAHFALPSSERLQATYFGFLQRILPLYGKIYISNRYFCFRSAIPTAKTKLILPIKDIENVNKDTRLGYSALVIIVRGHEELFFHFNQSEDRDDCNSTLHELLEATPYLEDPGLLMEEDRDDAEIAKVEYQQLQEARQEGQNEQENKMLEPIRDPLNPHGSPILKFDDPRASILNFKPTESFRITCLTIGSRGDVQPYIALCKGLLAEGHKPRIATHAEFGDWIRKHGIDFEPIAGDPAELMRICVEHGMFTYSFLREATTKFRGWLDGLLSTAWTACQGTDILIESPSTMAGIHIAEALAIPYFRAFTMPWTRTKTYPHAFAVPERKLGGNYNLMTYLMVDNVFWKASAGQINRWRKEQLGLRSTSLNQMQPNTVPFLYNFSPHVVPPPLDYRDWIHITGYWFLDEGSAWTPPQPLTNFIARARADEKKIVYIGFGSITVPDSAALTKTVVEAVQKADVRCILSKGWSDRLDKKGSTEPEVPLPAEIHQIQSAPHDWLFRQIDAAMHHGGAGTTGASLRAGIPTIVRPFFGDQFFYGTRVEDLGVGIYVRKTNATVLGRALWEATKSQRMITKAKVLGEQIRKEDGVAEAIQALYRDLDYAKSQIKRRAHRTADPELPPGGGINDEEWTLIGDEGDPDVAKHFIDYEQPRKGFQVGGVGGEGGESGSGRERRSIDLGA